MDRTMRKRAVRKKYSPSTDPLRDIRIVPKSAWHLRVRASTFLYQATVKTT